MKLRINTKQLIILLILLFCIWLFAIYLDTKKGEKLRNEYPVLNINQRVDSRIKSVKKIRGGCFVTTQNEDKFLIHNSRNYKYKRPGIYENLSITDSISKKQNSDTVIIYKRNGEIMFFVHKEMINEDLRK